jgi:hypothetical protein
VNLRRRLYFAGPIVAIKAALLGILLRILSSGTGAD